MRHSESIAGSIEASRRLRRLIKGRSFTFESPFYQVRYSYTLARQVVRIFYFFSAFVCYQLMPEFDQLARTSSASSWEFLWPLRWMEGTDIQQSIRVLLLVGFVAALLTSLRSNSRWLRAIFAACCLCIVAFPNSQGSINHGLHMWLWIAIFAVALPPHGNSPARRIDQMNYISVFLAIQSLLLFFYTLSGFWKLKAGFESLLAGEAGNFSLLSLPRIVAHRAVQTGDSPMLADLLIDFHLLAWPAFMALILIQLFSVLIAFRPNLHRIWGVLLASFHLGTWLLLEITFAYQLLLVLLFFVMSPFHPMDWKARNALEDIPILGFLPKLWTKHKNSQATSMGHVKQ